MQRKVASGPPVILYIKLVRPPARQIVRDQVCETGRTYRSKQKRGERVACIGSVGQGGSAGSEVENTRGLHRSYVVLPGQDALVAALESMHTDGAAQVIRDLEV